jgi:hypothetical protein
MEGEGFQQLPSSQPTYEQQMQSQHLYETQQDPLRSMSVDDLIATIRSLKSSLDEVTNKQERQPYELLQSQMNELRGMLNNNLRTDATSMGQSSTPRPTPPEPYRNYTVQRAEKPRLPNVEVFDKGPHEEYLQWKMKVQAKLYGDRAAYPTETDQVNYVITRTTGQAFNVLTPMVSGLMDGTTQPLLVTTWAHLDGFFKDPTAREKALEYLRTTKQGKNDFNKHVQNFNLKLQEAALDGTSHAQKIDYLKNSLNSKLLRAQAGYQPLGLETYEQFVQRARITWENLKAVDRITSSNNYYTRTYDNPGSQDTQRRNSNEMDWQPTVGAHQPRTKKREYWGTDEEIRERRTSGACLKCGNKGHMVRDCKKKAPSKSPSRTGKQRPTLRTPKVAAIQSAEDASSSEEEGKEEP